MKRQQYLINRVWAFFLALLLSLFSFCGEVEAGNRFKIVKSTSEIKDGDIVIVAKVKNNVQSVSSSISIATKSDATTMEGIKIEIVDGVATVGEGVDRLKLKKAKKDGYFYLYSCAKSMYICNATTKSTYAMAFRSEKDKKFSTSAAFTIEFGDDGNVNLHYPKNTDFYEASLLFSYMQDVHEGYFKCNNSGRWNDQYYCIQLYKLIEDEVSLDETIDNSSVITANTSNQVNVTLSRTLVAGKWNTFCVPFDVNLTDEGKKLNGVGVTVMEYADMLGNIMMFTQASKIEAGKAYLVKPDADISNPRFEKVSIVDKEPVVSGTEGGYSFRGVYSPKQFSAEERITSLIVTGDASLKRPEENGKMKGMRAYLTTPVEVSAEDSPKLMIGGQVTGISDIMVDTPTGDTAYGLDGVPVDPGKLPQKGIYIKNGKKYLVR